VDGGGERAVGGRSDGAKVGRLGGDDDLSPSRLGRERRTGRRTEAGTIERLLDVEAFRQEILEGLELVAGSGAIQDVFGEEDAAA